jgi:hypothetical protein
MLIERLESHNKNPPADGNGTSTIIFIMTHRFPTPPTGGSLHSLSCDSLRCIPTLIFSPDPGRRSPLISASKGGSSAYPATLYCRSPTHLRRYFIFLSPNAAELPVNYKPPLPSRRCEVLPTLSRMLKYCDPSHVIPECFPIPRYVSISGKFL